MSLSCKPPPHKRGEATRAQNVSDGPAPEHDPFDQAPTLGEIADGLRLFVQPGQVTEARFLNVVDDPKYPAYTLSGWFDFDHLDQMARTIQTYAPKAEGSYFVFNPIDPELLSLACNKVRKITGKTRNNRTTEDRHILRRCKLVVDADPVRRSATTGETLPPEIPSTDEEKARAHERLQEVVASLKSKGWPEPILADSGNGHHAIFAIDLPPEDNDLVKRVLRALDHRFSDDLVKIDKSLSNPSRIIKAYGSLARKGDSTPSRPHRYSRILSVPDCLTLVDQGQLEAVAAEAPREEPEVPVATREQVPPSKNGQAVAGDQSKVLERARKCVFAMQDSVAGEHGHNQLYAVACALVDGFGLSEAEAAPIFADWNRDKAKPPESAKQLKHKLADAIKNHPTPSLELLHAERPATTRPARQAMEIAQGGRGGDPGSFAGFAGRFPQESPNFDKGRFAGFAGPSPPECPKFEGDPKPLAVDLLPVPILDPRMVPSPFRGWLCDIAERGCFPLEYPTAAAIVGLSGLVGRKLAIRPKRHDDWLVVPNLWGACVGLPGIQKTPAVDEAMRPLTRLAVEALQQHNEAVKRHIEEQLVSSARAKAAKAALEKAAKSKRSDEDLRRLAAEASIEREHCEPTAKRYLVNDCTVEKLGELLSENRHGLTQFRDELVGFFRTMDRQGHESDRGFYLEAWNGLGSYVYDRIGRGTLIIPNVCLAIFGTIQPGPLARYLRGAASGEEADGFMPRFQVLVYPDPPAEFVNVDRYPATEAKHRAWAIYQTLDTFDAEQVGCQVHEDRDLPYIGFTPDAQEFFDAWRTDLENRLRSGEDNTLMQCHLSKYRSLMPSLALLFHLIDQAHTSQLPLVSLSAARMAAAWCDFLEAHARRVYQSAVSGDPEGAMHLAERLKQSLPNPFTFRQVAKKGWAGLTTNDEVRRAVGFLEDRGWVQVIEAPPGPQGGRPSEQVWIHPKLQGKVLEEGAAA